MPGSTRETPGKHRETPRKHPGNTIKGAGLDKKTSLAKLVGIFNKAKEKNIAPGNSWETPGKHLGKVHLLMFSIKGVLEKKLL